MGKEKEEFLKSEDGFSDKLDIHEACVDADDLIAAAEEDAFQEDIPDEGNETGEKKVLAFAPDNYEDVYSQFRLYPLEDAFYRSRMPKPLHWSVVWSDLMMTMFIMFAVMYVFQAAHRSFLGDEILVEGQFGTAGMNEMPGVGGKGPLDPSAPLEGSLSKIYDLSKQTFDAQDLREFASVDLATDKAVRIILTGDLLFDLGKADLQPGAMRSLVKISEIIKRTPYVVTVAGHTDSIPIHNDKFATNWELSAMRATAVARFLVEEMRVPGNRVSVKGFSYFNPIAPNDTEKNRAINRRVEIIITKDPSEPLPAVSEDLFPEGTSGQINIKPGGV